MPLETFLEDEEKCKEVFSFSRKFSAFHSQTKRKVKGSATIADTYFTIPATTATQYGFLSSRADGELEFTPFSVQLVTPKEFQKQYKKSYEDKKGK